MGKRKVALFMATILTVTSVYPGGAVFAEEAVATEPAIEAAADETLGNVALEDEAAMDATADIADDEESGLAEVFDDEYGEEESAAEGSVEDITADEPQLVIEDSEVVETSVVPVEADATTDVESITFNTTDDRVHVLHVADYFDELEFTVHYKNGEEKTAIQSYREEFNKWVYDLGDGQNVTVSLPTEALSVVDDDTIGKPGTYTATLMVDGISFENDPLTVEIYGGLPESLIEMKNDLTEDIEQMNSGDSLYYAFTPQTSGLYVINNPIGKAKVYQIENDEYTFIAPQDVEGCVQPVVSLTKGARYVLYLYNSIYNGFNNGTVRIALRKTPLEYTLDAKSVYNAAMAEPEFNKLTLTISYDDNSTEELPGQEEWNTTGRGPDQFSYTKTSQNGEELMLFLQDKNGEFVGVPYDNFYGDYVPLGTYRLCVTLRDDEGDSRPELTGKEVTFEIPTGTSELTLDDSQPLQMGAYSSACYYFYPQETKDYTFSVNNTNAAVRVYQVSDSRMDRVSSDSIGGGEATSFSAEAGKTYLAVVRSDSEAVAGSASIKQKKAIQKVTINAKQSYNMFELEKALQGSIEAEILYEGETQPEIIDHWGEMDNEYLSSTAGNGDEVQLSLCRNGEPVLLPEYEDSYPAKGQYALRVSVIGSDGDEITHEDLDIELTDPEYVDTLEPGKDYSFTIEQDGITCYRLGTVSAGPCRIHIKKDDIGGVHTDVYRVTEDGFIYEGAGTFEAEEGEEYIAVLYGVDYKPANGTLAVEVPVKITKITANAPEILNAMEAEENLMALSVTVTYSDGTNETCSGWKRTGMGTYQLDTNRGDTLFMFLTRAGDANEEIEKLSEERIPLGQCQFNISDDSPEIMDTTFSQPVTIDPVDAAQMAESFAMEAESSAEYSIPVQTTEKILKMSCSREGVTEKGGDLGARLYREDADAYTLARELGDYQYGITIKEEYGVLEEGQKYLLCLKSHDKSKLNVSLDICGKRILESEELQAELSDPIPQNDVLDALLGTKVKLTYTDKSEAIVERWKQEYNTVTEEVGLSALSANGEEIVLAVFEGTRVVQLPWGGEEPLDPGEYTLRLFVDGAEKQSVAFEVKEAEEEDLEAEAVELDTEALAGTVSEEQSKWYSFTPNESGEYVFGICKKISGPISIWANMYDSRMNYIEVQEITPYDEAYTLEAFLQAGETYYLEVKCRIEDPNVDVQEVDFTLTLEKSAELTGIEILNPEELAPEQLEYQEGTICTLIRLNNLRVAFTYSNGKMREPGDLIGDFYGNIYEPGLYPLDNAGKPDMNNGPIAWDVELTVGKYAYAFVAGKMAPDRVENNSTYLKFERNPDINPAWVEVNVVAGHAHKWVAGQNVAAATVTTAAQRQYECSVCHAKETRSEGSPLPATLTVPATKANMKTGQSTGVFTVGMSAGDSVASVTSSNTKLMKVKSFNPITGVIKLKAGKKTGKVKITIKLASGQSKVITLNVQKKKVTTKKVKVTKKLTLKKGEKYTLKPVITPITTQDKVKFKSSNKKIAAVTNKGAITAKKPGKVTITVTCGKKKATCKITVTN